MQSSGADPSGRGDLNRATRQADLLEQELRLEQLRRDLEGLRAGE